MVNKIRELMQKKETFAMIAGICFVVIAASFACFGGSSELKVHYIESNQLMPANPLIGYAPQAESGYLTEDISLVYMDVTWAELEPTEGNFDWTGIESRNHLERWKEEGKHVVFRFLLDYPTDEVHKDIPDWVYEKINGQGDHYDIDYGKGFSPDYSHPELIRYHKRAVEAMGHRWGQDGFIAYIQLGSIGHWGEWHIKFQEGLKEMPKADIREQYITPYITAFPYARILMRRPFKTAKAYNFGVYNDLTGDKKATEEWVDWLNHGGNFSQAGEKNELIPMPKWWEYVPVGGEFTSALSMNDLMIRNLNRTLDLIEDTHITFLGPKIAEQFGNDRNGYDRIRRKMGYRFWISNAEIINSKNNSQIKLLWQNTGIAPMYHKWNSYIYIEDGSGNHITTVKVPIDLTTLQPNTAQEIFIDIDDIALDPDIHNIYLGVVDPMTGRDAIHFAMKGQEFETRIRLFHKRGK